MRAANYLQGWWGLVCSAGCLVWGKVYVMARLRSFGLLCCWFIGVFWPGTTWYSSGGGMRQCFFVGLSVVCLVVLGGYAAGWFKSLQTVCYQTLAVLWAFPGAGLLFFNLRQSFRGPGLVLYETVFIRAWGLVGTSPPLKI